MLTKLAVLILLCYLSNGEKVKSSSSSSESDESSKEVPVQKFIWPEACTFDGIAKVASCKPTKDQGVGTLITSIASSPRAQDVRTLIFHCSEPLGHVLATPASPIEELTLSNCGISSITIGKSHTGTALKHLDLSKNNLTTVPYFGYLPELTELDLADNSIRSIREGSFTFNEKLETIDLSRNNIKRIELNAFERPLKKITLDENLKVVCDKDWPLFLRYATKNNVEWSLPGSNDVQCDSE